MIECIDTIADFRELRADWDALYEAAGSSNPFLTHAWLTPLLTHICPQFAVLVSRPAPGAPLDAAAVFDTHEAGTWCYLSSHSYRPGILHTPEHSMPLRPFLSYIALHQRQVERLVLDRCDDSAEFRAQLDSNLGPLSFLWTPDAPSVSRIIRCESSLDAYLDSCPSKVRGNIRRKMRRLDKDRPDVVFEELPRSAGRVGALGVIEQVELDSWKAEAETAIVSHENEQRFYGEVFELSTARTRGRLFQLRGDDGPMAFIIGVCHGDSFYALKTSYRAEHSRLSPGQLVFTYLIDYLTRHEPEVQHIELLGYDARWKRELSVVAREEQRYIIARPTPRGVAFALAKRHLVPALREAAERDPRVGRAYEMAKQLGRRLGRRESDAS